MDADLGMLIVSGCEGGSSQVLESGCCHSSWTFLVVVRPQVNYYVLGKTFCAWHFLVTTKQRFIAFVPNSAEIHEIPQSSPKSPHSCPCFTGEVSELNHEIPARKGFPLASQFEVGQRASKNICCCHTTSNGTTSEKENSGTNQMC